MKSSIYSLLIATFANSDVASAGGPHGPGGMGSPFEQFRNPNAEDETMGSDVGPIVPEDLAPEEKFEFDNVMTPEEEACYTKRYTDVGSMSANEHYARTGEK